MKVTSTIAEFRTYDSPEAWLRVAGDVAGWPYMVSSWGRVESQHTFHGRAPRIHSVRLSHDGYQYVKLRCDGRVKFCKVHILVAEAFIGLRPDGLVVNHRDKDRQNNRPENLEWVTVQRNTEHGWETGRVNKMRKLTSEQAASVRHRYALGVSQIEMAKELGVSDSTIAAIIHGRSYRRLAIA